MAGIVANYAVSTADASMLLEVGGDTERSLEFLLPSDVVAADSPMVVTFLLGSSVNSLSMRILLNGTLVSASEYRDDLSERSIHELVNISDPRSRNTMTFTVFRGRATISDVVLWYQRDARPDS
jgi:hypothetical protein